MTRWQDQEASVGRGDGEGAIHHCYMRHTLPACYTACLSATNTTQYQLYSIVHATTQKILKNMNKRSTRMAQFCCYNLFLGRSNKKVVNEHVALCTKFWEKASIWLLLVHCASEGIYSSFRNRATSVVHGDRNSWNPQQAGATPSTKSNPCWVKRGSGKNMH